MNRREFMKLGSLFAAGGLLATVGQIEINDETNTPVVERVEIPDQKPETGARGTHDRAAERHPFAALYQAGAGPAGCRDVQRSAAGPDRPDGGLCLARPGGGLRGWPRSWPVSMPATGCIPCWAITITGWMWKPPNGHSPSQGCPCSSTRAWRISTQGNGSFYLAGMDDGWSGQPDLNQAVEKTLSDVPIVLLLHEPDLVDETSRDPRIALQLSGHTHGGQVLLAGRPPIFTPDLGKKYSQGLFKVNDTLAVHQPRPGRDQRAPAPRLPA